MVNPTPRRWLAASALTGSVLALRLAALAQTGCAPLRTDAAWRTTLRARVETVEAQR